MADVLRVTTLWGGFVGAPGFTSMHFGPGGGSLTEAADAATAAVRTFWDTIKGNLPSTVTLNVQQEVPFFDIATGHLTSVANSTSPPLVVAGTNSNPVAAPAGAQVLWLTGALRGTRRLRGRTFIVPLSSQAMETNGSLLATFITSLSGAAATLRATAATPMQVWGRPSPALGAGFAAPVAGHAVRDKVCVLRSRRD